MIPIPSPGGPSVVPMALTLLAAVVPALVTWWTDRQLLDKGDDPALPELLASRRRTNIRAIAIGFAIVIVFGGGGALWGLPLLAVLLISASYPLRARLLGETWGFGAYLGYTLLSAAGGFGFWIALAYAPSIVQGFLGEFDVERWPIVLALSVVLAVVLFALEEWYPRLWLWAHAAEPLAHPVLTPRFAEIVERAGTIVPRVYRVGPQGSRFVNAVALPSVKRPAVAMGTALLELLEPDESVAIFAHEVAHFDYYTPRRIQRSQLINRLLIIVGVSLPFVTTVLLGGRIGWIGWLWPIVILVTLVRRAARSQQRETDSDLRAAALCGDPEALVRGLTKLHFHARVPRRYAVDVERAATHPSLVRRIQAIRGGGATASEQLGAATVVRSTRAGGWIVLDADRAYWLEGVRDGAGGDLAALRDAASSYRAVSYADLVELRVTASGDARTLTARVQGGDAWSVPIAGEDVARIQRTLDVVDLRLAKPGPAPSPALSKVIALAMLIAVLLSGQTGIVLAPIAIAMWKPSAAAFAALGATSIVRAVLGAIEGSTWFDENTARLGLIGMAVLGLAALYTASRMARGGDGQRHVRLTMTVFVGMALVLIAALVWQVTQASAGTLVGAPLLGALGAVVVGIAAVLFLLPARWNRAGAYAALAAGAALATVGVDRKALSLRNALTETTARATLEAEMDIGDVAYGLRVSPSGAHFMAVRAPVARRPMSRVASLALGTFGGRMRSVAAIGGDFVDDDRILVLDQIDVGLELRLEAVDSGAAPIWSDTLTDVDLTDPRLVVDRDGGGWSVVGEDTENDRTAVFAGRIGEKGTTTRVGIPDTIPIVGDPIVFDQAATVIIPTYVNTLRGEPARLWAMPLAGMDPLRTELWRLRGDSLVRMASLRGVPQCGEPLDGVAACTTTHVRGTSLHTVDANGVAVEVAQLTSRNMGNVVLGPGARGAAMTFDRGIVLIDLAARRLTTFSLPPDTDYASDVRAGDGYIITLTQTPESKSKVRRYRIH